MHASTLRCEAMATINGFGRADIRPYVGRAVSFSGYTVLSTAEDGSIGPDPDAGPVPAGLYDFDTRILSRHRLLLDGEPVPLVSAAQPDWSRRSITLRRELPDGTPEGPRLSARFARGLGRRRVGRGMLEEIEVANHSAIGASTTLDLQVDADFEELIARQGDRQQVGRTDARLGRRRTRARAPVPGEARRSVGRTRPAPPGGRVERPAGGPRPGAAVRLRPRAEGHERVAHLAYESLVDDEWRSPVDLGERGRRAHRARRGARRVRRRSGPTCGRPSIGVGRAIRDRRRRPRGAPHVRARCAGPTRPECRTTARPAGSRPPACRSSRASSAATSSRPAGNRCSWHSDIARGAVEAAARTQATTDSAEHDAEPGKMIHEMRRGPLVRPRDHPAARVLRLADNARDVRARALGAVALDRRR